jgi:hypothetical protein
MARRQYRRPIGAVEASALSAGYGLDPAALFVA